MRKKLDTRFPAARIKKIMQADEDVGKIALATPVLVSKALELFLQDLCDKTYEVTVGRGAKTMSGAHLKQCVAAHNEFDFLQETVARAEDGCVEGTGLEDRNGGGRGHRRKFSEEEDGSSEEADVKEPDVKEPKRAKKVGGGGRGRGRGRGNSEQGSGAGRSGNGASRGRPRKDAQASQQSAALGRVKEDSTVISRTASGAVKAEPLDEPQVEDVKPKVTNAPKKSEPRDFDLNMDLNAEPEAFCPKLEQDDKSIMKTEPFESVEHRTMVKLEQDRGDESKQDLDKVDVVSSKPLTIHQLPNSSAVRQPVDDYDDDDYDSHSNEDG